MFFLTSLNERNEKQTSFLIPTLKPLFCFNFRNVSWDDAQEFIRKLNEQDSAYNYRLPTEAEWEKAARAGTTTAYSFGNRTVELSDYAIYDTDSTAQVASKQANQLGLYDMYGNVYQWCQNGYYIAPTETEDDPTGDDSSSLRHWMSLTI